MRFRHGSFVPIADIAIAAPVSGSTVFGSAKNPLLRHYMVRRSAITNSGREMSWETTTNSSGASGDPQILPEVEDRPS